jgi:hypothetical protein
MPLIAVLPGDGIGPEVTTQARRVLEALDLGLQFEEAPVGGAAYLVAGRPLPPDTLALAKRANAVLFGAIGDPRFEGLERQLRPEAALLGIRRELGLFANLRPATLFPGLEDASPLKPEVVANLDIVIVRELVGDVYFGEKGRRTNVEGLRQGFDVMSYNEAEVERIARVGFEMAKRRKKKLCSVDKANVLETSQLWRDVVNEMSTDYPEIPEIIEVARDRIAGADCVIDEARQRKTAVYPLHQRVLGFVMACPGEAHLRLSSTDHDDSVGRECIFGNLEVLRRGALADAARGIISRAVARAEIAAERPAILALARAEGHAAEMGAYAQGDQPVGMAFLGALLQRLRIAQARHGNRVGRGDLRRREVAHEQGLLAEARLDRLARLDRRDVELGGRLREHVGGRVHRIDQRQHGDARAHAGKCHGGDLEIIAATRVLDHFAWWDHGLGRGNTVFKRCHASALALRTIREERAA